MAEPSLTTLCPVAVGDCDRDLLGAPPSRRLGPGGRAPFRRPASRRCALCSCSAWTRERDPSLAAIRSSSGRPRIAVSPSDSWNSQRHAWPTTGETIPFARPAHTRRTIELATIRRFAAPPRRRNRGSHRLAHARRRLDCSLGAPLTSRTRETGRYRQWAASSSTAPRPACKEQRNAAEATRRLRPSVWTHRQRRRYDAP